MHDRGRSTIEGVWNLLPFQPESIEHSPLRAPRRSNRPSFASRFAASASPLTAVVTPVGIELHPCYPTRREAWRIWIQCRNGPKVGGDHLSPTRLLGQDGTYASHDSESTRQGFTPSLCIRRLGRTMRRCPSAGGRRPLDRRPQSSRLPPCEFHQGRATAPKSDVGGQRKERARQGIQRQDLH